MPSKALIWDHKKPPFSIAREIWRNNAGPPRKKHRPHTIVRINSKRQPQKNSMCISRYPVRQREQEVFLYLLCHHYHIALKIGLHGIHNSSHPMKIVPMCLIMMSGHPYESSSTVIKSMEPGIDKILVICEQHFVFLFWLSVHTHYISWWSECQQCDRYVGNFRRLLGHARRWPLHSPGWSKPIKQYVKMNKQLQRTAKLGQQEIILTRWSRRFLPRLASNTTNRPIFALSLQSAKLLSHRKDSGRRHKKGCVSTYGRWLLVTDPPV